MPLALTDTDPEAVPCAPAAAVLDTVADAPGDAEGASVGRVEGDAGAEGAVDVLPVGVAPPVKVGGSLNVRVGLAVTVTDSVGLGPGEEDCVDDADDVGDTAGLRVCDGDGAVDADAPGVELAPAPAIAQLVPGVVGASAKPRNSPADGVLIARQPELPL